MRTCSGIINENTPAIGVLISGCRWPRKLEAHRTPYSSLISKITSMLASLFLFLAQIPILLVSAIPSEEEKEAVLCEQLERVTRRLELLLPEGNSESLCNLPWDYNRLIAVDLDAIFEEKIVFNGYVHTDLIGASAKGKILVLPEWEKNRYKTTLCINHSQYTLIGGVVRVATRDKQFSSYKAFTVDTKGISYDGLDHISLEYCSRPCFNDMSLFKHDLVLPKTTKGLDGLVYRLKYEYMIYEDVGLLEIPYPIQHLSLNSNLISVGDLRKILGIDNTLGGIIGQGIALLRFILLWDAIKKELPLKNDILEAIRIELLELKEEEIENKKSLLMRTCEFIQHNAEDHEHDPFPFFSILREQDSTITEALVAGLENPLSNDAQIGEVFCDDLSDELAIYHHRNDWRIRVPYWLKIPCGGNSKRKVTFKLIAAFDQDGKLVTCGVDYDHSRNEEILRLASYGLQSYVEIVNSSLPSSQQSLSAGNRLLIYQHFRDNDRFSKTRPALSLL